MRVMPRCRSRCQVLGSLWRSIVLLYVRSHYRGLHSSLYVNDGPLPFYYDWHDCIRTTIVTKTKPLRAAALPPLCLLFPSSSPEVGGYILPLHLSWNARIVYLIYPRLSLFPGPSCTVPQHSTLTSRSDAAIAFQALEKWAQPLGVKAVVAAVVVRVVVVLPYRVCSATSLLSS